MLRRSLVFCSQRRGKAPMIFHQSIDRSSVESEFIADYENQPKTHSDGGRGQGKYWASQSQTEMWSPSL